MKAPAKADIAVVLAGDYWGHRLIERRRNWSRQGYVPRVLVSGPPGFYGYNEADVAIHFAVGKGYPAEWFIPLRHTGAFHPGGGRCMSWTNCERRNIHSFLLVTSDYHTARARRIYLRRNAGAAAGRSCAWWPRATSFSRAANWWRNREGRKTVFLEWTKTVASALGM